MKTEHTSKITLTVNGRDHLVKYIANNRALVIESDTDHLDRRYVLAWYQVTNQWAIWKELEDGSMVLGSYFKPGSFHAAEIHHAKKTWIAADDARTEARNSRLNGAYNA